MMGAQLAFGMWHKYSHFGSSEDMLQANKVTFLRTESGLSALCWSCVITSPSLNCAGIVVVGQQDEKERSEVSCQDATSASTFLL